MNSERFALIFPGQGSQKVGMLSEHYAASSTFSNTFNEASEALGYDLWALVEQGPEERLNLTENTQPALLTSSVAIFRVWQELGGAQPDFVAGHSLGEWSALVCAGVLSLADAARLVQLRGRYMQQAVPVGEGGMAAIIGLPDQAVIDICKADSIDGYVAAVNFNAPGQVVIAGEKNAVAQACQACKDAGAKRAMPLPVSAPFHTSMMQPAADQLARDMESVNFLDPIVPTVHNVNAQIESKGEVIKARMIEQITAPVRWVECVQTLVSQGVVEAAECGPGRVLGGMVKRIDKSLACAALETPEAMQAVLAAPNE